MFAGDCLDISQKLKYGTGLRRTISKLKKMEKFPLRVMSGEYYTVPIPKAAEMYGIAQIQLNMLHQELPIHPLDFGKIGVKKLPLKKLVYLEIEHRCRNLFCFNTMCLHEASQLENIPPKEFTN